MTEDDPLQRKGPGRPPVRAAGPEPGRSYVDALRKWPDEHAKIKRTELAEKLDVPPNTISTQLRNPDRTWKPSKTRLSWALRIISACEGSETDQKNWTTYHYAVARFMETGSAGDPPRPPNRGDALMERPETTVELPEENPPRRKGLVMAGAIGLILLAGLATVIWVELASDENPAARITVISKPDDLILPKQLRDNMGNYATTLSIGEVPPPPNGADRCAGRYEWAHSAPINGTDVNSSIAKIDITAVGADLTVDRVGLHLDRSGDKPPATTMLACPGGGGNQPPHLLAVNLDSRERYFLPDGGDQPATFNLKIPKGKTDTLLLHGFALNTYASWRLELGGDDGTKTFEFTIGPDGAREGTADKNPGQRSFETIGENTAIPYRYVEGSWQQTR